MTEFSLLVVTMCGHQIDVCNVWQYLFVLLIPYLECVLLFSTAVYICFELGIHVSYISQLVPFQK